ncbi:MAG TPA: cyclic pyranopterin monophosphate synthase MoaC [Candidatus Tumulicola sp.]|jgi:cyclic pyranopterin phosphate synthase
MTHFSPAGVRMVDVAEKNETLRSARARAVVRIGSQAREALQGAGGPKGDPFLTAQLAGIAAAKQTATLIPLAHPIPIAAVDVRLEWLDDDAIAIETFVRTVARTGVEMEAMVAATVAALTIYDMCKAFDKSITIESAYLLEKSGGKSGSWKRNDGGADV